MRLENWNPAVKMSTVFIMSFALAFKDSTGLNLAVFVLVLMLILICSRAEPRRLLYFLLPALFAASGIFVMGLYHGRGSGDAALSVMSMGDSGIWSAVPYMARAVTRGDWVSACQLSSRVLAYAGLGILFTLTTDKESFVLSLMHQFRLSPKFAYGILAAVSLLPHIQREYGQVRLAFKTRGIPVGALSPRLLYTMLVNAIHWSEYVAMAMESKGFCGDGPRSYYQLPGLGIGDIAAALICLSALGIGMLWL